MFNKTLFLTVCYFMPTLGMITTDVTKDPFVLLVDLTINMHRQEFNKYSFDSLLNVISSVISAYQDPVSDFDIGQGYTSLDEIEKFVDEDYLIAFKNYEKGEDIFYLTILEFKKNSFNR